MKISWPNSTPQNQLSHSIALKNPYVFRQIARKIPAWTLILGQIVFKHQQQKALATTTPYQLLK